MLRWSGRVALVTGASAGIGAGIAEALAREGMVVVACARRLDRLQAMSESLSAAKFRLHPIQCDMSKEEDLLSMFQEIKTKFGGVDVLINNAGVYTPSQELLTGDSSSWKSMLDINILALSICTREAYKSMKERSIDDGQILNICSISGHKVGPLVEGNFYSATKFAVRALTEGVRKELRLLNSHIRVGQISPGYVETEIIATFRGEEGSREFFSSVQSMKVKDIVDSVIYILSAPPHVQVHDIILTPCEQE